MRLSKLSNSASLGTHIDHRIMAMEVPLTFATQLDEATPQSGLKESDAADYDQLKQPPEQAASVDHAQVHCRYLWKHPNREARVTLYSDGTVSFAHLSMGRSLPDCAPHGKWKHREGNLHITFHHMANTYKEREHVFLRYGRDLDVWYLSGHFDKENAVDFAFLQPWTDADKAASAER